MAETAFHIVCCILFFIASICDEYERKIPRCLSHMEVLCGCLCWCARYYVNQQFVFGNLLISAGLFAVIVFFYLKGQIGRGDLYLLLTMFLLLSSGQATRDLIWEENMMLLAAFLSAAIRLSVRRLGRSGAVRPGCPFAVHLLLGYMVVIAC